MEVSGLTLLYRNGQPVNGLWGSHSTGDGYVVLLRLRVCEGELLAGRLSVDLQSSD